MYNFALKLSHCWIVYLYSSQSVAPIVQKTPREVQIPFSQYCRRHCRTVVLLTSKKQQRTEELYTQTHISYPFSAKYTVQNSTVLCIQIWSSIYYLQILKARLVSGSRSGKWMYVYSYKSHRGGGWLLKLVFQDLNSFLSSHVICYMIC